jgi:hypothetical protein
VLLVGARGRVVLATFWIVAQAVLVGTAPMRADGIFGFRMFPEASTIEIHVVRQVGAELIPAPRGEWRARNRLGQAHLFSWRDRVRDPILSTTDARVFASYGADAQLARLQRALDDLAVHEPDDAETTRFGAVVIVRKNGRDPVTVTLLGRARPGS